MKKIGFHELMQTAVTVSPVLGSPAISIISLLAAAEHTAFYGTMSILTRTMSMDVRENE